MLDVIKKFKVPTKEGATVHKFRSDWKPVYRISYSDSKNIFKCINGNGNIEKEDQFVRYVLKKFGPGIYYFRLYKKGQKGFRDFLYVEIQNNRFRRLKPLDRFYQKRIIGMKHKIEKLKAELRSCNPEDRGDLEYDLWEAEEEMKEIKYSKKSKYPYPYLSSIIPVYSWHGIDEENFEIEDEKEFQRLR